MHCAGSTLPDPFFSPHSSSTPLRRFPNFMAAEFHLFTITITTGPVQLLHSCGACDSLFPSLMALEHHKEEFQHWSDSSWCSNSGSSEPELEPDSDAELDKHRLL
ncbi:hypothetical protein EVAR_35813_1 [Eumeta japonica]|uniref:C2H2-type domain-containing protein n=1 Tax=Eumeta variegata TaxID=151549 RepID=A0A4C1WNM7_EUMVA|nr:hypothetical protein EVAR_35813_1 [Eumeta japonica]